MNCSGALVRPALVSTIEAVPGLESSAALTVARMRFGFMTVVGRGCPFHDTAAGPKNPEPVIDSWSSGLPLTAEICEIPLTTSGGAVIDSAEGFETVPFGLFTEIWIVAGFESSAAGTETVNEVAAVAEGTSSESWPLLFHTTTAPLTKLKPPIVRLKALSAGADAGLRLEITGPGERNAV